MLISIFANLRYIIDNQQITIQQLFCHLCNIIFDTFPIICINSVEIVIQNVANLQQDISCYPLAFKNMVNVLPRVVQLTGKPRHRPLLAGELLFDKVTDMWYFVGCHATLKFADTT